MIETFKILNTYDKEVTPHITLSASVTRGHNLKARPIPCREKSTKILF